MKVLFISLPLGEKKKIEPKVFLTVDKISEDVQLEKKKNQFEEFRQKYALLWRSEHLESGFVQ